jgi:hypothetical protein
VQRITLISFRWADSLYHIDSNICKDKYRLQKPCRRYSGCAYIFLTLQQPLSSALLQQFAGVALQTIGDLANWSLVAARFNFLFGASEFHSDSRPIFDAPRLNSISTSSYLHQETSHTASASQLHSSLRMGLRICFSHISFRAERKQAFRSPSSELPPDQLRQTSCLLSEDIRPGHSCNNFYRARQRPI